MSASANGVKKNADYFLLNPWTGESDDHEEWEKVLAMKALELGGDLMYRWIRNEGPIVNAGNLGEIGVTSSRS